MESSVFSLGYNDSHIEESVASVKNPNSKTVKRGKNNVRYMYVRDSNRNPFGVVAFKFKKKNNKYNCYFAWSLCHKDDSKKFTKRLAKDIAYKRLTTETETDKSFVTKTRTCAGKSIYPILEKIVDNPGDYPVRLYKWAMNYYENHALPIDSSISLYCDNYRDSTCNDTQYHTERQ